MRHLDRMASCSSETNMHARNLAIVWAPNLLRLHALTLIHCGEVPLSQTPIRNLCFLRWPAMQQPDDSRMHTNVNRFLQHRNHATGSQCNSELPSKYCQWSIKFGSTDLLTDFNNSRTISLSGGNLLVVPTNRSKAGEGTFTVYVLWNKLPVDLRSTTHLSTFKTRVFPPNL